MTFKLIEDPKNHKSLLANQKLPKHITKGIRMGSYISGKQLVADLRADMQKRKSGRVYKIYRGVGGRLSRPRNHRASSRFETPGIVTGEFRESIDFKVRGNKTLEFGSGSRNKAVEYAKALELGTSNIAARKPLGRTVKKLQNQVRTNIAKEINKQIESLGFNITRI
jgi:hypothetical protein